MKARTFVFLVTIFLTCSLSTGVFLTWWSSGHHALKAAEVNQAVFKDPITKERQHITFVLGEDEEADNPYFEHAASYYRQEVREGLDTVITNLKTLLEVNQYLAENPPRNTLPWGEIRLIVHSNEWTGLSAPIMEGIKRTTVSGMKKALDQGHFTSLAQNISDADTQLQLWSCGLGHNAELLQIIGQAFGQAIVYSPKHFVQYRKDQWGQMKRYLNRCYYTTYPTGYRPSTTTLSQQLRRTYPDIKLNWSAALDTPAGSLENQAYNYSFKIPLVWLVSYEDKASRPNVKTTEQKDQWLAQQIELQEAFEYYRLEKEDFTWTIYPKMHTFSDCITEPSIKAIGLCTILCILEPIGDPESGEGFAFLPLSPSLEDKEFFGMN